MNRLKRRPGSWYEVCWRRSVAPPGDAGAVGRAGRGWERRDASGLTGRRNLYCDANTGQCTQQDPIGIAGGLNLYGYAGGDPINGSDPFGLKVCFKGKDQQRLADSTAAATGTTFNLDSGGCAENVQAAGGKWNASSRGFASLAADTLFTYDMAYGIGGSRFDNNGMTIDLGQVGTPYGTQRQGAGCVSSSGAVYDEVSIVAHELGHAYAFQQGWSAGRSTSTAIGWENRINRGRGRPSRSVRCH